jgi:hypothetical protein
MAFFMENKMTEKTWVGDEFENWKWQCQGWTLIIWRNTTYLDIEGPGNVEAWVDKGCFEVKHESEGTSWHGPQAELTSIPIDVLREIVRWQDALVNNQLSVTN